MDINPWSHLPHHRFGCLVEGAVDPMTVALSVDSFLPIYIFQCFEEGAARSNRVALSVAHVPS